MDLLYPSHMSDFIIIFKVVVIVMYYCGLATLIDVVCNGAEELQCWNFLSTPSFYVEFQRKIDLTGLSYWRVLFELEKIRIRQRLKEMLPRRFS